MKTKTRSITIVLSFFLLSLSCALGQNQVSIAQHKFREAIDVLNEAINIDGTVAAAHHFLGYAYLSLGKKKRASHEFESAVRLRSQNAESRYFLGLTSLSLGRRDEAIQQFRELETLDPILATELSRVLSVILIKR